MKYIQLVFYQLFTNYRVDTVMTVGVLFKIKVIAENLPPLQVKELKLT